MSGWRRAALVALAAAGASLAAGLLYPLLVRPPDLRVGWALGGALLVTSVSAIVLHSIHEGLRRSRFTKSRPGSREAGDASGVGPIEDYSTLPARRRFLLAELYVLDIAERDNAMVMRVDLCHAADHPVLRPPLAGERAAVTRARITVTGVRSVERLEPDDAWRESMGPSFWDDTFDTFSRDGDTFTVRSDIGDVRVIASHVRIDLV